MGRAGPMNDGPDIARLKARVGELEDRIEELEEVLCEKSAVRALPIAPMLRAYVGLLLARDMVRTESALIVLYPDPDRRPDPKVIQTYVCWLRPWLAGYGVRVETRHGEGYFVPREDKTKLRHLVDNPPMEVCGARSPRLNLRAKREKALAL